MNNTIKLNGDVSGFKKAISDLSKDLKGMSLKSKIQIFDKNTKDFITKEAKKGLGEIASAYRSLGAELSDISLELKSQQISTEKRVELERKALALAKERVKVGKSFTEMRASVESATGQRQGDYGTGLKSGKSGLLGKIPVVGKMLEGGMPSIPTTLLGLGAAMLGFGINRGMQGYGRFKEGIDDRIKLRGRGFGEEEIVGRSQRMQRLGYGSDEVRQARMQAADIFGRSGARDVDLARAGATARAKGLDLSQLLGSASGLRAQVGTQNAQKTFAQMQATLIASSIDGAIGPYLETMSNMLTEINQDGMGLDSAALSALSSLTNNPKLGVSPERAQRVLGGIDESIRGATGDRAAFFMSALGSTVKGGNLGSLQFAQAQGLFGGSAKGVSALRPEERNELMRQGLIIPEGGEGGAFSKRARAITGQFNKITGNMSTTGRAAVAGNILGMRNPAEALQAMRLLEKAQTAAPKEQEKIKKQLEDLMKTPEEKSLSVMESIEGDMKKTQAQTQNASEILGDKIAPAMMSIDQTLAHIDEMLASLIPGSKTAAERSQERIAGLSTATEADINQLSETDTLKLRDQILAKQKSATAYLDSQRGLDGGPAQANPHKQTQPTKDPKFDQYMANLDRMMAMINGHLSAIARSTTRPKNTNQAGRPATR